MISKRISNAYSIWFIPNDKQFIFFKKIIIEISQFFEDITFIPHITLISNLDYSPIFLSQKVKNIAKMIPPFKIYYKEVDYLNDFFQSFFISIKKNSDLNHAREIALLNFPEIKAKYHPHLSLAYGNIDLKVKKSLKKKIQCPFKHVNVKELYLAHNDEINFKWKIIDKFNLTQ